MNSGLRRALGVGAGVGVVICAALLVGVVGMWVRSHVIWEKVSHTSSRMIAPGEPEGDATGGWWTCRLRTYWLLTGRGVLSIGFDTYDSLGPDAGELAAQWTSTLGWGYESFGAGGGAAPRPWFRWDPPAAISILDIGYEQAMRQGIDIRLVTLPAWLLVLVLAVPLALWARARRRRVWRARVGRCVACGYDRRGLSPRTACPECGRASAG